MKSILKRYLIITLSVIILPQLISAVKFEQSLMETFKSTFILTLLYYLFRPLASLITLPINILTLNLFSWILNIFIFYFWTLFTPGLIIDNWMFSGLSIGPIALSQAHLIRWQVVIVSAIILTFIIRFFEWLLK